MAKEPCYLRALRSKDHGFQDRRVLPVFSCSVLEQKKVES